MSESMPWRLAFSVACAWVFCTSPPLWPLAASQQTAPSCDLPASKKLAASARSAFERRQYATAARQFQEALDACPQEHSLLLELSQAFSRQRDFPQSIQAARQFLAKDPNSVSGHVVLANALFMTQQLPQALQEAERALQQQPGHPAALKIKANTHYLLGEVGQAQKTFIDLLDRHPSDEEAAYMLGRIYYQEGRIDHAIGQFQRVLKTNPYSYKAYDNLGLCYEARGEAEMAIRHFLTSIKLVEKDHPEYDWPYANLANLLLNQGQAQKAFDAAATAAQRNPNSARNFYLGGKALCKLDKTELCVNWLERSTALDPNYPEPLYLLARVYGQLGQEEKAKQVLQKFQEAKAKRSNTPK